MENAEWIWICLRKYIIYIRNCFHPKINNAYILFVTGDLQNTYHSRILQAKPLTLSFTCVSVDNIRSKNTVNRCQTFAKDFSSNLHTGGIIGITTF